MPPLKLKPRAPLPPFTFSPSPPHPSSSSTGGPSHPPSDFFPERDMQIFGAHPLLGGRAERGRGLVSCTPCGRVVMEASWADHQRVCKHVLEGSPLANKRGISGKSIKTADSKKRRASEDSDEGPSRKKSHKQPTDRSVNLPSAGAGKTATAEGGGSKGIKLKKLEIKRLNREKERLEKKENKEKEKKEVAERKRMRVSGPIDLDRQCGVINDKGHPCARSLTCKTHTVGAKRSVPGRTRGYDELYLEWQRANNPKFKEPTKIMSKKPGMAGAAKYPGGKDKKFKGEDDELLGGRGMGEAELREFVQFARTAGERCRLNSLAIGGGAGGCLGGAAKAPIAANGKAKAAAAAAAAGKQKQRHPSSGRSSAGGYGGYGGASSLWATGGSMGFAGVGEALIQALSARPARIEPIRLVVPAAAPSAPPADAATGLRIPTPHISISAADPSAASGPQPQGKKGRPTGLTMPASQQQLQAQMLQAQVQQAQAQLGQLPQSQAQGQMAAPQALGLGQGQQKYPPQLMQQMQALHGQGMNAQAMLAAAVAAATSQGQGQSGTAGMAGLQSGGMGMGGMQGMGGGGANGMSMMQQYQQGMMQQQQAGMMQAGGGGGGMYGVQSQ